MNSKPIITETIPFDWTSEEEILAKEAIRTLNIHYPGWKWGVEFTKGSSLGIGCMVIRLMDVPTQTVYVINPKDIDRDRMICAMRAGGLMLEAHGLRVGAARRNDDVRSLRRTPAGIILPDLAAVPDTNPGYDTIKKQIQTLR